MKFIGLAVITAIAFAAIALTLHFTVHGQPIPGWTADSLLMVTALPGGLVSVISWLLLAILYPKCKKQERELNEEIQRQLQDPNSPINEDIRRWCERMRGPLNDLHSSYRELIEQEGTDLISTLRKLKDGTLVPDSEEEKEIFLMAPLLHP